MLARTALSFRHALADAISFFLSELTYTEYARDVVETPKPPITCLSTSYLFTMVNDN